MVSLVQLVFLIDVNYLSNCSQDELEKRRNKLLLCSLRLITEFGAQTDKGNENVRWSFKFYDSRRFKPDTSQKIFYDYNKESTIKFNDALQKIVSQTKSHSPNNMGKMDIKDSLDKTQNFINNLPHPKKRSNKSDILVQNKRNEGSSKALKVELKSSDPQTKYSHSYILNKSLQEILLDYDWDRPTISSPVRTSKSLDQNKKRTIKNSEQVDSEVLNFVIVFMCIPYNLEEIKTFIDKKVCQKTDFFKSIFDPPTLRGFKEEKQLRLHLINISETPIEPLIKASFQSDLRKVDGDVHELNNLVQDKTHEIVKLVNNKNKNSIFKNSGSDNPVKGSEISVNINNWCDIKKSSISKSVNKNIYHENTNFIWEDENGISFLQISIECFNITGR